MKFCAVISEYNPFHNGHKYQLEEIGRQSGCERTLCIMSGGFTQRGEIAVLDKFARARHAVQNGADVVLELPAAFATAPAELFAQGAVHILSALGNVDVLAFGCESGDRESFLTTAQATLSEDKQFKETLKENLKDGTSFIRARNAAVLALNSDVDEALLTSPNNILGTEYCRALLKETSEIQPLPIPRVGSGYADRELRTNFSSATALRAALFAPTRKSKKLLKKNVPADVFDDLETVKRTPFEVAALCAIVDATDEAIAATPDCSEGLENKLKALAKSNPVYSEMLEKAVSKRYTLSRLKRILVQNLLKVRLDDVRNYLAAPLYAKVLAVKKEGAEEILSSLVGSIPLITRKSDYSLLKKEALACFTTDLRANDLYNTLTGTYTNEFQTLFV